MKSTEEDYINYRIQRAWMTLEDAKSLANIRSWNSSMNRLYYACFYGVLGLFAKFKINSHTHSGTKTQLSQHFVKTGKLKKEFGLLYSDLFDLRQKGDYGEFINFTEEQVNPLIPLVEEFLHQIEEMIKE